MSELRKWLTLAVGVFLLVLAVSFVAGQCRDWRTPKPPKPVPGHLDPGTPAPGPVNEAPTIDDAGIARPNLTVAELEAEAAKAGFKLVRKGQNSASGAVQGSPKPPAPAEDASRTEIVAPAPASGSDVFVQKLFAKEHFGPGPAGDGVTIWAWQMEEDGRVELWADFDPYQSPPVPPAPVSYFGNTAKWEKFIMLGYVGQVVRHDDGTTETKADPGIGLGLAFHSWRIGKANIDARAVALVTPNGGAAIGGAGLSW